LGVTITTTVDFAISHSVRNTSANISSDWNCFQDRMVFQHGMVLALWIKIGGKISVFFYVYYTSSSFFYPWFRFSSL